MPKVSEEHKEAMRQRIAAAARRVFVAKGFAAASMAEIVAEAGVSAGAVYLYYPSKADLLIAAARTALSDRFAILDTALEEESMAPPQDVVPRIVESLSEEVQLPRMVIQVWAESVHNEELSGVAREVFGGISRHVCEYLTAWLGQEGLGPDEAARRAGEVTPAVLGLVQGGVLRLAVLGVGPGDDYVASIRALLAGLTPRRE